MSAADYTRFVQMRVGLLPAKRCELWIGCISASGDPFRVGREQLPHGTAGDGGTDGKPFAQAGQVPRRLELPSYAARGLTVIKLFWREP